MAELTTMVAKNSKEWLDLMQELKSPRLLKVWANLKEKLITL